jgi:hypothetical protein
MVAAGAAGGALALTSLLGCAEAKGAPEQVPPGTTTNLSPYTGLRQDPTLGKPCGTTVGEVATVEVDSTLPVDTRGMGRGDNPNPFSKAEIKVVGIPEAEADRVAPGNTCDGPIVWVDPKDANGLKFPEPAPTDSATS